ncbi:MAG: hypothetical protein HYS55_03710 [Candidatus Omnitrophica bacterium]|nr:hypothetical protein [Candidatus Omnitrophota bacterium]
MKESFNWKSGSRWFVLLVLISVFTGCAELKWFLGLREEGESARGCAFVPGGGCAGRAVPLTLREDVFGPFGYEQMMGTSSQTRGIRARDMGFGKDVPEYRPINPSSSND